MSIFYLTFQYKEHPKGVLFVLTYEFGGIRSRIKKSLQWSDFSGRLSGRERRGAERKQAKQRPKEIPPLAVDEGI